MEILPLELDGLRLVRPKVFRDWRGDFVKSFHSPTFEQAGIRLAVREEFFSVSKLKVVRGMHFQLPPHTQERLVYCLAGRILDVVVDLRKSSPTFGRVISRELSETNREMLFIPAGFAHGFLSLSEGCLVNYLASQPHNPAHDTGILWNTIDFNWPIQDAEAILSERDQSFVALPDFSSPF